MRIEHATIEAQCKMTDLLALHYEIAKDGGAGGDYKKLESMISEMCAMAAIGIMETKTRQDNAALQGDFTGLG